MMCEECKGHSAVFESKGNHPTAWLSFEHPEGKFSSALEEDLRAKGWHDSDRDKGLAKFPPIDGLETTFFSKNGTALFAGWTFEEREEFIREAKQVLLKHGFENVPVHKLTLEELM